MTRKDPPSVVHILGSLDPGGVEIWLLDIFAQTRGRVTHTVVTLGPGPGSLEDAAAEQDVAVVRCPLHPLPRFPGRFTDTLRSTSPTVVHSHVHHASGGLLWRARRSGVPVRVAHAHVTDDGHRSTLARRLYRRVGTELIRRHATAGVAAASEAAAALFGQGWADDPRFRVVHYGVDLERFAGPAARAEVRRELGFPDDAVLLGQLGRFHPVKNHAFALRVAEILAGSRPDLRFVFIGHGPLRGEIEEQVQRLGLRSRCALIGSSRDGVPRLLSALDLLLHPSLSEGLPVSLIEAQAAGVPVLASAAVTREAAAVPGLVRFVDLREGPEGWAAEAQKALDLARPSATRRRLSGTDFDIRRSAGHFLELYGAS